jgi:hypothetical protein
VGEKRRKLAGAINVEIQTRKKDRAKKDQWLSGGPLFVQAGSPSLVGPEQLEVAILHNKVTFDTAHSRTNLQVPSPLPNH